MKQIFILVMILSATITKAQKVHIGSTFNEVGNELTLLVQNQCGMTEKKSEMRDSVMILQYIPKVVTRDVQSLSFYYTLSSDGRITRIEIKGTMTELRKLFSMYWKTKADQSSRCSEKHFVSDVIRFYRGESPYITISKA